MRKKLLYIVLIISIIVPLVSCGGNNKINIGGSVTLNFATFYDSGSRKDAYQEIISKFEVNHKNIKINLQAQSNGYDDAIKAAFQKDGGPDIIGLQRTKMIDYVKQGYIKDLSSWVNSQGLKDKYFGVDIGYGKYGDKYYGIGDLPYVVQWYYNVDIFKKAGVNKPKNMDELIKACSKLKKYTKNPIIIGMKDPWAVDTFFGAIAVQTMNMGELAQAYGSGKNQSFANLDGSYDTVNILSKLNKSGAITSKLSNYDYAASIDAFVKGKGAILPMGSWAVEKIEKVKPSGFRYNVFDDPVEFVSDPQSKLSATAVQVITVNGKGKHQKEAMEFMNYLVSEEAQKIFAEKNGISGLKSANSPSSDPVKSQTLKQLELTDENSVMYIDNISDKMMNSTGKRLQEMIDGTLKSQDTWNTIINESYPQ